MSRGILHETYPGYSISRSCEVMWGVPAQQGSKVVRGVQSSALQVRGLPIASSAARVRPASKGHNLPRQPGTSIAATATAATDAH